eukprot:47296-Amphidinium_carterae.1
MNCKTKTQDWQRTPINAFTCVAFNNREQRLQIVAPFSQCTSNNDGVLADLPCWAKARQRQNFSCGMHHLALVHQQDVD